MMRRVSFSGYQIYKAIFKVKVVIASDNEAIIFISKQKEFLIKITKGDDEIMNYTIEKITEDREWYKFTDINAKGEKLLIEVMKITCDLKNKKFDNEFVEKERIY